MFKISSIIIGNEIHVPETSREYYGWSNIVGSLGFINIYIMDPLSIIQAYLMGWSMISICCQLSMHPGISPRIPPL